MQRSAFSAVGCVNAEIGNFLSDEANVRNRNFIQRLIKLGRLDLKLFIPDNLRDSV